METSFRLKFPKNLGCGKFPDFKFKKESENFSLGHTYFCFDYELFRPFLRHKLFTKALPSISTIQSWYQKSEDVVGGLQNSLKLLRRRVEQEMAMTKITLMLDEMAIKKQLSPVTLIR